MEDWIIAGEIYFLGFVIALVMAVIIKLMLLIMRSSGKKSAAVTPTVSASGDAVTSAAAREGEVK